MLSPRPTRELSFTTKAPKRAKITQDPNTWLSPRLSMACRQRFFQSRKSFFPTCLVFRLGPSRTDRSARATKDFDGRFQHHPRRRSSHELHTEHGQTE